LVDINYNSYIKTYKALNIYTNECEAIHMNIYKSIKDIVFNPYQRILKNTYICNCYYNKDKTDKWNYYITNILNPDESITSHYLNATNSQFICSTIHNDDNLCELGMYVKINKNNINVTWKNELYYNGLLKIYQNIN